MRSAKENWQRLRQFFVLVDDAADGFRVGWIAHAVQDDLRHGRLALHPSPRLEIDALGEALRSLAVKTSAGSAVAAQA